MDPSTARAVNPVPSDTHLVASSAEVLAAKDQPWARDATLLTDLLVQFGLVAVNKDGKRVLPYHATYVDEAEKPDAVYSV